MADYLLLSEKIKTHDGFMENMKACLYAAEKHGVVFGQEIEDRESLIETARKYLPEYSLTEQVNADCALIKQSVVDMWGAPDESCGNLWEALEEYCERINKYGYCAVVAHHAMYSRDGATAEEQITRRQSGPPSRAQQAAPLQRARTGKSPHCFLLPFLPLLDEGYYAKKRILFECTNLPPTHCGTTEVMLPAFEAFSRLFGQKYDISLLTNREAAKYHKLEEKYGKVLYPDTINETYHLGYVPVQMHRYESQLLLNKHCLKIAQQVLDIIMVRSYKLHDLAARANIELGIRFSDGITFISNFSKDDFMAYYANEGYIKDKKCKVIYVTKEFARLTDTVNSDCMLPFDEFVLVIGNTFKHKAISETLEAASKTPHNLIVVGARKTGKIGPHIYGYRSGQLDEGFMNLLYSRCTAILFPSMYEGFGLPIIMGIKNNKRVIVYDNELNRELYEHFADFKENFVFFSAFDQVAGILNETDFSTAVVAKGAFNDSWERVATELESFFAEILCDEIDVEKLKERWWVYRHIAEKSALRQFGDYKMSSMLRFSIKENIKHRHPRLLKVLKKVLGS